MRDARFWGLLALRGYLAFVFLQAAIGHLGVPFDTLARTWTPTGAFAPLGASVSHDPTLFVGAVVALELALAVSMIVGVLTRLAGLGGLLLNAFFFAAFEWADRGQVYLSGDASLAVLWLLVLLTAPGQYLGLGRFLVDRYPRIAPWIV
ncbi:MAG TPA: hypothetical protein VGS18_02230 [Thermoplasmata archaeon]|nr:hypothetical protein [Thermoplasmata archaeon]